MCDSALSGGGTLGVVLWNSALSGAKTSYEDKKHFGLAMALALTGYKRDSLRMSLDSGGLNYLYRDFFSSAIKAELRV